MLKLSRNAVFPGNCTVLLTERTVEVCVGLTGDSYTCAKAGDTVPMRRKRTKIVNINLNIIYLIVRFIVAEL